MDNMKAVVFDCDGTLIDSVDVVIDSIHYALRRVGAEDHSSEEIHALFGPGADEILKKLIGEEAKAREAYEYYLQSQKTHALDMVVFRGIREVLQSLKESDIACALVTGRHSRDLSVVLKAHQLEQFFNCVIADDQLKKPKPSPEGLELAAKQLQIPCEKIFYVGDSLADIETSHRAGSKIISALWDRHVERKKILKNHPDFIAYRPLEILPIIFSETTEKTSTFSADISGIHHRDSSKLALQKEEPPSR